MKRRTLLLALLLVMLGIIDIRNPSRAVSQSVVENQGSVLYMPLIQYNPIQETWIGPYGGKVVSLAISKSNPSFLYAGTWGAGIFVTADGGSTWQPASQGLGSFYIQSLAVDPNNPLVAYAGTYKDRLYKTSDGGTTWFTANNGIQNQAVIYSIAINPQNTSVVYASTRGVTHDGAWNGKLYKSTNAGSSWSVVLENVGGTGFQDWAYSLAINPADPKWVFAAFHQHGPYRSTDAGSSWKAKGNGASPVSRGIAVASTNPLTLYTANWTTCDLHVCNYDGGVFRSNNGGDSWTPQMAGILGEDAYTISVDPQNPQVLYLGTHSIGLVKSTTGGNTWAPINSGFPFIDAIFAIVNHPYDSKIVYTGTAFGGVYRSENGGASWSKANHGLSGSPITAVVSRPDNPEVVLASFSDGGVFHSNDGGQTWSDVTGVLAPQSIHSLAISPANNNLVFALTDTAGLFRMDLSTNSGWISTNSGIPSANDSFQAAYDNGHPFAGQSISEDELIELQENPDQALSILANGHKPLLNMVFDSTNPQVAYLGTSTSGLYRSQDGGIKWEPKGLSSLSVYDIAIDPNNPEQLYAATNDTPSIKISSNGGDGWDNVNLADGTAAYTIAAATGAEPGVIYAGTNHGVYKRFSNGVWQPAGLSDLTVNVILTHPSQPGLVLAGTNNGYYITSNGGVSWSLGAQQSPGLVIQSLNYTAYSPTTNERVLIGTQTKGILSLGTK